MDARNLKGNINGIWCMILCYYDICYDVTYDVILYVIYATYNLHHVKISWFCNLYKTSLTSLYLFCRRFSFNGIAAKIKGEGRPKECGIGLDNSYWWCWYPFPGPPARKCNGGWGPPILCFHTSFLVRLGLSIQIHTTDHRFKVNNLRHQDSNSCPHAQGILSLAC